MSTYVNTDLGIKIRQTEYLDYTNNVCSDITPGIYIIIYEYFENETEKIRITKKLIKSNVCSP